MTRYEILKEAHELLLHDTAPGICSAIRIVFDRLNYYGKIKYYIPLFNINNAVKFNANPVELYWWKPGKYSIFSGRRRFMRWLMRQYKNDKEEL